MQILFVVSHTHWDREWYEPFQIFRMRLVKCIDRLLDIFATDPDYKYFLLDGQTIVLEDYLEVRPDHAETLREYVRAGRLTIGPWYVLPDEFLVSGEAIIRNLLRGTRSAREFDAAMPIGYLPDPFGHISQMPQVLRGFGFDAAAFRRGLADEPTELWWDAPDGTRILACYLRDGYDNAAWLKRDDTGFVADIRRLRDSLAPFASTENILLMNGTDHMEPWQDLPRLLNAARAQVADAQIVHASLPMYVDAARNEIEQRKLNLPVVSGELRNPKRHHLLPGVASTRMWIKQRNAHAQMLLEKWAEPFAAFAAASVIASEAKQSPTHDLETPALAAGASVASSQKPLLATLAPPARAGVTRAKPRVQPPISNLQLLATAWKYLLQNHPHDSICGCGIDQVHAEMAPRFDACEQIAEQIIKESLATLAAAIDTRAFADSVPIIVFNPVAGPRTDFVTASIKMPDAPEDLVLLDDAGNEVPHEIHGKLSRSPKFEIEFVAREVPGYGYRTFQVKSEKPKGKSETTNDSLILENEFFRVEPNRDDGTLAITDKMTGTIYRGTNHFVDGGDRGDLYNYCSPENDTLIAQPNTPPRIEIERGAARQSLRIAMNYRLPEKLSDDRSARATETIDENIITLVSLYPGVRRIDFHTQVDNRAHDHRLRVEFPTPIVTGYANAEQAFDVVRRALDLPTDSASWIEQPRPEAPMQNFVSIDDGKTGLTLATRGLPEYEARRDAHGPTLALTLRRGTGWRSRDALSTRSQHAGPALETPGAQEIGAHVFEYALIPGNWRDAFAEAHAFVAPLRAVVTDVHAGALSPSAGFIEASPREFVISAIKPSERGDGLIVRGYNIGEEAIDARIKVGREFAGAARLNLNEDEIAPIPLKEGREVALRVRGKEIVTIELSRNQKPSRSA